MKVDQLLLYFMAYQIDIKHLQALINPFHDNITDIVAPESIDSVNFSIDVKQIRDLLKTLNFDNANEHISSIARYSGSYPKKAVISVFIGNPAQGDTPYLKDIESLYLFSAALYRQQEHIYVNAEGDTDAVSQLLHINDATPTIIADDFYTRKIDWQTRFQEENNVWTNPGYVITQVAEALKRSYSNKSGSSFINVLKMADKCVFDDAQFINDLLSMKNDAVDVLIRERFKTPLEILSLAYEKDFVVHKIWNSYATEKYELACRSQFQLEDELRHDHGQIISEYIDNMHNYHHLPKENMHLMFEDRMRMVDEQIATEAIEILEKARPFKKFFDEHIFNDVEKSIALMKKHNNPSLIKYFSKEVKGNIEFQNALIDMSDNNGFDSDLLRILPISCFDIKSDFSHLEMYVKLLKCLFLNSDGYICEDNKLTWFNYLPVFKDTQQMLVLLNHFNNDSDHVDSNYYTSMDCENIYNVLSDDVKNNKDIVMQLIKIKHNFFYELEDNIKQDFDVMNMYIKCGGSPSNVSSDVLFSQTDKHIILNIIGRDYKILNDPQCPPEWRTNHDYIEKCITHFPALKLNNHEIDVLFSDTNKGLQLLRPDIYRMLPDQYLEHHEYAIAILKMARNTPSGAHVPDILWTNDDFCIKAIQVKSDYAQHVPSFHWENRQFIIGVLEGIDTLTVNKDILNHMPKHISQFFLNNNLSSNYSAFFTSFLLQHDLQQSLPASSITRRQKKI